MSISIIKNRALIKVTGSDSENFLNSQLTNAVKEIHNHQVQLNGYCQHQGKLISLIWVMKKGNWFYLSFPENLKDVVLKRLMMFKLMSDVVFEDLTNELILYGLVNLSKEGEFRITNKLSVMISSELLNNIDSKDSWEMECFNEMIPEIEIFTSELHIPQALNLDIGEVGVSFSKGCYPGQEVVARMHYLGKPKRRLYKFVSHYQVIVGDFIYSKCSESLKPSGQILRVVKVDSTYHFLSTFENKYTNDEIYLNNNPLQKVDILHD